MTSSSGIHEIVLMIFTKRGNGADAPSSRRFPFRSTGSSSSIRNPSAYYIPKIPEFPHDPPRIDEHQKHNVILSEPHRGQRRIPRPFTSFRALAQGDMLLGAVIITYPRLNRISLQNLLGCFFPSVGDERAILRIADPESMVIDVPPA